MGTLDTQQAAIPHVESILRDELARGDKALASVAPVLSHLLGNPGYSLVNEAVVARLRGMLADLARQILAASGGQGALANLDPVHVDNLADDLARDSAILSHLYAIAMEAQFTQRLEARHSIDPVLGDLLQELIASENRAIAELAMNAMAAQSRFMQSQRRMEHPVTELPAELFDLTIKRSRVFLERAGMPSNLQLLKRGYDESTTRIGILNRLAAMIGGGAVAALDVGHAGFAQFVAVLARKSRQPRELAVLACHSRQAARLALSLRAAGLDEAQVERQLALFEPDDRLPSGIGDMPADRAQAILSHSPARTVG